MNQSPPTRRDKIIAGAILAAICGFLVFASVLRSSSTKPVSLVGRPMQIGPNSTPLCGSTNSLDSFMDAITRGDTRKAEEYCWMGKPGFQIDVLEDLGSYRDGKAGNALHVNVTGGGMTLPAYTIARGLVPRA